MVDGATGALRCDLGHGRGTVSTAEDAPAPPPIAYVAREVLERLVDDLTVEDVRLARMEYPEGDPMRGFAAVYHAAKRSGDLASEGEDPGAFLSRVRLRDLAPIMDAAGDSLGEGRSGTATSPHSADTGE
jgi:hypothetical protein